MTSLTFEDIDNILSILEIPLNGFPTFLETGTFQGSTILSMEHHFKILHTIEIKKEFYENVKNKYHGDKINFYLGDSINLLSDIKITDNTIYFLDGHFNSGDTGKGIKDVPLIEELNQIMEKCLHEAIIIIDDYRLFGKNEKDGVEDWSQINDKTLFNICKPRLISTFNLNDRFILHIRSINDNK